MKFSRVRIYLAIALILSATFFSANLSLAKDKQGGLTIVVPPEKYSPLNQSSESLKGRKEFELNHCASCHSIDAKGGCLAPPLDGIGARRNKTFILSRITDDDWARGEFAKLYPHPELFEHPRFPAPQAREIAAYLLTIPEPKHGYLVTGHSRVATVPTDAGRGPESARAKSDLNSVAVPSTPKSIAEGKALFDEHGCIACHAIGAVGGHFAPNFEDIGQRHDRKFIAEQMTAAEFMTRNYPDEYQGRGNAMPPSNLTGAEIQKITTFLMTLPKN